MPVGWRNSSMGASIRYVLDNQLIFIPCEWNLISSRQKIDLHYATKSLKGWPKIIFEIFNQDTYGRLELCKYHLRYLKLKGYVANNNYLSVVGYAVAHLPTSPGCHQMECSAWRPKGTTFKDYLQGIQIYLSTYCSNNAVLIHQHK